MGQVVSMKAFKQAQAVQAEPAPDGFESEQDAVDQWATYVRRSWRPVRGVKRGAVKAVMRIAWRASDEGKDWMKVVPIDLVMAGLPPRWTAENVHWATYLATLLWDYLWRLGDITEAEKKFAFAWCDKAEQELLDLLKRVGRYSDE